MQLASSTLLPPRPPVATATEAVDAFREGAMAAMTAYEAHEAAPEASGQQVGNLLLSASDAMGSAIGQLKQAAQAFGIDTPLELPAEMGTPVPSLLGSELIPAVEQAIAGARALGARLAGGETAPADGVGQMIRSAAEASIMGSVYVELATGAKPSEG